MKINQVEQLVGITKGNIRFYEKEGLLTPGRNNPPRSRLSLWDCPHASSSAWARSWIRSSRSSSPTEKRTRYAQGVAEYLRGHEKVAWVRYAGLPGDKYHALAQK